MKRIDMGGFGNEIIEVKFCGKTYEIMLDPPVEAYRKFIEIQDIKLDTEESWDKVKDFIATLIASTNDIDKGKFKESLTKFAVSNFLTGYTDIISRYSDSKNLESLPKKATRIKARKARK